MSSASVGWSTRLGALHGVVRARLLQALLGKHAIGVLFDTKNGLIVVPSHDDTFSNRLGKYGASDETALTELLSLVDATSRVLVVGAHLGVLAIPLAKKVERCVAIEANPDTFRFLQMNVALANLRNMTLHNVAANNENGDLRFVLSRSNSGGSKREPKHKDYVYYADDPKTVSVPAVVLDELLEGQTFDLVVVDIEGSEYFALQGMKRILSSCRNLHIEYVAHHLERVAGVDDEAFLSLLRPHFSTGRVSGTSRVVVESEFRELVRALKTDGGGDLLFSKS